MAPRCPNDTGSSVVFHRSTGGTNSFRLWTASSRTSFRRKIALTMCCGGASCLRVDQDDSSFRKCEPECKKISGSRKLSDLLKLSDPPCDVINEENMTMEDVKGKGKGKGKAEKMRTAVEKLRHDDVLGGATDVRRLTKDDSDSRKRLALLGAIPPLVALLDSEDIDSQIASLYALLNLGIGNDANKLAIVKAGGVQKMLNMVQSPNRYSKQSVIEAIIANFLSLSALDSNKPIIGSSGAIHILAATLKNMDDIISCQAKQDSVRALYNLSISPLNISNIVESDLIPSLLSTIGDMELTEKILSILSNAVSTAEGRKAISDSPDAFPILMDVLNWSDSPNCQEKALYVLMVMAHRSYRDKNAMIEAGIGSILLELTLLGSTLAQNRASRMLRSLRKDKGRGSVSAPMSRSLSTASSSVENKGGKEEKRAVKNLVHQSLMNNMRRIVKRANLPMDFFPSDRFKVLTSGSSSMSLPF